MRAPYKLGGLVNYFFLFRFLLRRFSRAGPWSHFFAGRHLCTTKERKKKKYFPFFLWFKGKGRRGESGGGGRHPGRRQVIKHIERNAKGGFHTQVFLGGGSGVSWFCASVLRPPWRPTRNGQQRWTRRSLSLTSVIALLKARKHEGLHGAQRRKKKYDVRNLSNHCAMLFTLRGRLRNSVPEEKRNDGNVGRICN